MCRGMACVHRPGALPAKGMDGRPCSPGAAHVPIAVGFAIKPKVARQMIMRAIAVNVPFSFVAADSVYGTGGVGTLLCQAGKRLCPGCCVQSCVPLLGQTAGCRRYHRRDRVEPCQKGLWRRVLSGGGTKGPRWHDWAHLELADLSASEYNDDLAGEWTRGLPIRRNIADGSLVFILHMVPKGHVHAEAGICGRPSLGHRGHLRNRQE